MPKKPEKSHASLQTGLVISYYGKTVAVEMPDGQVLTCHIRRNQDLPVVGDEVSIELEQGGESGIVKAITPRRSMLARGDRGGQKPLAANIDLMVMVMTPPPGFSEYLLDRYLIVAELLNIEPVIVMNKVDLLSPDGLAAAKARLQLYADIPYSVVYSSVKEAHGLDQLREQLRGHRAVLVGPSGVGKSSIISALGSEEEIRIGDVSDKGVGKHTTTATRLYRLADGGELIDSPGVREFNLWPITEQEVLQGFREMNKDYGSCKFRDCKHAVEPECAVQKAVADGRISPQRFESYKEFLQQAIDPQEQYK